MDLWPHQIKAMVQIGTALRGGHKSVCAVLPTGAGKTRCAVEMVRRLAGRRVLWLGHRIELLAQASTTLSRAGLRVGLIAASDSTDAAAPIQIASIPTLCARPDCRPPANWIVWDECHHAGEGAESWAEILVAYPGARLIGLTATPERGDGTGLNPPFTTLVQPVTVRELTEAGYLVPSEIVRPDRALERHEIAQDPVDAWIAHCHSRQGFVFARSVEDATTIAQRLVARGVVAKVVHAKTPADERAAILVGFRAGRIAVLCNVFVFTEGTDLPMASACLLARPFGTAGGYLQAVGRVLRCAQGKRDALIVDLCGTSHRWGPPEEERAWKLDGKALVRGELRLCRVCQKGIDEYPCVHCGATAPSGGGEDEKPQTITNDPLVKFARMIAQGPEARRETLLRWLRQAAHEGRSSGFVTHKWQAVYQSPLPFEWYKEGLRELAHDGETADWAKAQFARWKKRRAS
jgi:DNA repair protein RadD